MPTSPEITDSAAYQVVRLNKNNLADVAKLHAAVYGTAVAVDHFTNKYNTAYTGIEDVGFIAYNTNNRPVAYYGVIPCFIQFENEIMLAAQSADTMTDPQHRYKGMFKELSNMTFDLCRQLGIRLIFGFPNQNFYNATVNRSGWRTTETMDCFTVPVNGFPLESIFRKINSFKKLYRQYRFSILKKKFTPLNGLANSVMIDGFAGVYRSDEYLYYKTYNASKVIRVDDSKIWINGRHGLVIGDMEGVNEKNFRAVIKKLKMIAKKLGVRRIQFHSSPGTGLHKLFLANYKPKPSFPVIFQDFGSAISPEKIKFTFADIDIF